MYNLNKEEFYHINEDIIMNKDIIKGHWKEIKGKVKQEWGKLTDDDIARIEGNYDQLEGLIQKQYGYRKDQAEKAIEKFIEKCRLKERSF